ncbi:hypothetical protein Tco_1073139 [Tanacetum coccineum]
MSSANVARSHGGDGGGEDRPPPPHVPTGCEGCFINRGKGKRKPNLGGTGAGRLNTRDKTRNLSQKDIAEAKGPISINFDVGDKQTLNPLGPYAVHWSNYIGEVVRSVSFSWEKVPKERKAAIISNIRCQRMLHGVMAVTVAVMIVPLHTRYPPVVGVAWATEVRAPENPIWVAEERAGSIPARRPGTSG